ncbi:hypothetical protein LG325_09320 [Marinobacter nauticus]
MQFIKRFYTREIICSVLVGSVPCALIAKYGSMEAVMLAADALNPSWALMLYFIGLMLLPSAVGFLVLQVPDDSLEDSTPRTRLQGAAKEVSKSLHGIYRSAAGFSAFLMIPAVMIQPTLPNFLILAMALVFSVGCIFVCCLLSAWEAKQGCQ